MFETITIPAKQNYKITKIVLITIVWIITAFIITNIIAQQGENLIISLTVGVAAASMAAMVLYKNLLNRPATLEISEQGLKTKGKSKEKSIDWGDVKSWSENNPDRYGSYSGWFFVDNSSGRRFAIEKDHYTEENWNVIYTVIKNKLEKNILSNDLPADAVDIKASSNTNISNDLDKTGITTNNDKSESINEKYYSNRNGVIVVGMLFFFTGGAAAILIGKLYLGILSVIFGPLFLFGLLRTAVISLKQNSIEIRHRWKSRAGISYAYKDISELKKNSSNQIEITVDGNNIQIPSGLSQKDIDTVFAKMEKLIQKVKNT